MRSKFAYPIAGVLALLGVAFLAGMDSVTAETGSIAVENAWARATPKGAKVASGYLTIKNQGNKPDRLVSARADFAGKAEIHLTKMADGVAQMRPVTDGLAIPAKGSVALEPNSYHLMFMDLAGPLSEGETVRGELIFELAGSVAVTFQVMGIGAQAPDAQSQEHHHH
jgi:copper(I)-binding protein